MDGLLILIPIALGLGLVGLVAFLWSVRSGQFEDLEGAAHRVLFDDDQGKAKAPKKEGVSHLPNKSSQKEK
ncbi:cbb3-type cytochrome oxidase assembly protein CcoS [Aestuariispira insulae]|uniref:Cbb3-type cytochrome oxidase maturation protein n=1 Tax=Aestuariispira insulae TaxID=1461337 RepID=A0A3D9HNG8_9PROT|nr:cbb3-type cytochrome oxidase assembly protein CcoS [Aestuariispira insulae]RED51018.1 cbb3-type cytochrome oxidase maturation protein [Aestuariispira insulae]